MVDQFTEVTEENWFSRLGSSCFGAIIGIVLFFASFAVLFWNEGRTDFSQLANKAVPIEATRSAPQNVDKLVSVTGEIITTERLGDDRFLLPGDYVAVQREVEMYAWSEEKRTRSRKKVGGSEVRETTYTYTREWTGNPENSSTFKQSAGHQNPNKRIPDYSDRVSQAKIGIYALDMRPLQLPRGERLALRPDRLQLNRNIQLAGNYLFQGNGSLNNPDVGDLRMQYWVLPNRARATVFGRLADDNRLGVYRQGGDRFFRLLLGGRSQAIQTMRTEHRVLTWVLRGVGFLMMWFGLIFAASPISTFLDVLPFLGDLAEMITGFASFFVALILSAITIVVSILLHNLVALLIAIAVGLVAVSLVRRSLKSA